jgi:hypothetical protein
MATQIASAENSPAAKRTVPSNPVASSSGPALPNAAETSAPPSTPAQTISSSLQLSTDMKVDDQHRVYYEFIDDSTGNVLFEIPPAALREIGESLNLPGVGETAAHSVDVKS